MLTGPVPGAVALSLETPPLPHEASTSDARASAARLANRRHAPKALRITASPCSRSFLPRVMVRERCVDSTQSHLADAVLRDTFFGGIYIAVQRGLRYH